MTTMMMIARELSPPPSLDPAALPLCDGAEGDKVDTVGVVDGTVGKVVGDEVDTGGEVVGDKVGTAGEVVSSVVPQNEVHVTSLQP
jgi:hypothetical protein